MGQRGNGRQILKEIYRRITPDRYQKAYLIHQIGQIGPVLLQFYGAQQPHCDVALQCIYGHTSRIQGE